MLLSVRKRDQERDNSKLEEDRQPPAKSEYSNSHVRIPQLETSGSTRPRAPPMRYDAQ